MKLFEIICVTTSKSGFDNPAILVVGSAKTKASAKNKMAKAVAAVEEAVGDKLVETLIEDGRTVCQVKDKGIKAYVFDIVSVETDDNKSINLPV